MNFNINIFDFWSGRYVWFCLFLHPCWWLLWRFICPCCVSSDSGKWRRTVLEVKVVHVLKLPAFIALIKVFSVGKPAAACKYRTVWLIEGRSYTLFTCSFVDKSFADIVHNFAPCDLHPWRMGGSVVVIVTVPDLWIVSPSSPGWKILVYPSSANLLTLTSGAFSPGRMSASLGLSLSC